MDLMLRDNTVNVFLKLLLEVIVCNLWDLTYTVRLERLLNFCRTYPFKTSKGFLAIERVKLNFKISLYINSYNISVWIGVLVFFYMTLKLSPPPELALT